MDAEDSGLNIIFNLMIYYTQLIYIKPGKEKVFEEYENKVLPILAKYEGSLLLRVRPNANSLIDSSIDIPYEIHLVSFPDRKSFDNYAGDETRKSVLALKEESTLHVLLIEGVAI